MHLLDDLVDYAHRMSSDHLAFGTSGNLSVRDDEALWITPSGVPFEETAIDNVVGIAIASGKIIHGSARPSSELPLHLALYRQRRDVGGIVHTHSEYATIFAVLGQPIIPVHYQMARSCYQVNCAEYATYGSEQLAQNALATLGSRDRAVLLRNHGLVAVGDQLSLAYQTALDVEWMARLLYRARSIGDPRVLSPLEVEQVREQFRHYGQ